MVNYQPGSIVSKIILKKQTGNITVFAFDKGESLSEHTVPFEALIYVVDGAVIITISGRTFKVKKGEFIIMPANKPHSVRAKIRFKMVLFMIRK